MKTPLKMLLQGIGILSAALACIFIAQAVLAQEKSETVEQKASRLMRELSNDNWHTRKTAEKEIVDSAADELLDHLWQQASGIKDVEVKTCLTRIFKKTDYVPPKERKILKPLFDRLGNNNPDITLKSYRKLKNLAEDQPWDSYVKRMARRVFGPRPSEDALEASMSFVNEDIKQVRVQPEGFPVLKVQLKNTLDKRTIWVPLPNAIGVELAIGKSERFYGWATIIVLDGRVLPWRREDNFFFTRLEPGQTKEILVVPVTYETFGSGAGDETAPPKSCRTAIYVAASHSIFRPDAESEEELKKIMIEDALKPMCRQWKAKREIPVLPPIPEEKDELVELKLDTDKCEPGADIILRLRCGSTAWKDWQEKKEVDIIAAGPKGTFVLSKSKLVKTKERTFEIKTKAPEKPGSYILWVKRPGHLFEAYFPGSTEMELNVTEPRKETEK